MIKNNKEIIDRKVVCPICERTFRNANGLRLHSKKHKDVVIPKTGEVILSYPFAKKTIADVVIPETGEVILSYSLEIHGEDFGKLAVGMANKKRCKVVFR